MNKKDKDGYMDSKAIAGICNEEMSNVTWDEFLISLTGERLALSTSTSQTIVSGGRCMLGIACP